MPKFWMHFPKVCNLVAALLSLMGLQLAMKAAMGASSQSPETECFDLCLCSIGPFMNSLIAACPLICGELPGLETIEKFHPDIGRANALRLGDAADDGNAGRQAPFHHAEYQAAIARHNEYKCGQSFFRHNLRWTSTPAVRILISN